MLSIHLDMTHVLKKSTLVKMNIYEFKGLVNNQLSECIDDAIIILAN